MFRSALAAAASLSALPHISRMFRQAFAHCGFDSYLACEFTGPPLNRQVRFLNGEMNIAILNHAVVYEFGRRDRALKESLARRTPVFWADLQRLELAPEEASMIEECRELGLQEVCTYVTRASGRHGRAVMLASHRPIAPDETLRAEAARLASAYDAAIVEALESACGPPRHVELSDRQLECLRWTSAGKSAADIGDILGLSARTVEDHIAAACRKLSVRTRLQAVSRAVRLGIITPE